MANSEEKQVRAARVKLELDTRRRLAVPTVVGGVFYLLGAITATAALNGAPSVGVLQGLAPAIAGDANPKVSPRAPELVFLSNHSLALIVGALLVALGYAALILALLFLYGSTHFRRPNIWPAVRPLVLYGGIAVAVISLAHQVVIAIETHRFAVSSDHSAAAVEKTLTTGSAVLIVEYVALFGGLAFTVGMVMLLINTLRVGLLARWLALFGMFAALLLFLPVGGAQLQVVPALWMVFVGILFYGRWPSGDPPAWEAGEAVPWPPAGTPKDGSEPTRRGGRRGAPALSPPEPEPLPATGEAGTSRKRRKRR